MISIGCKLEAFGSNASVGMDVWTSWGEAEKWVNLHASMSLYTPPAEGVSRIKGVSSWLRIWIKGVCFPPSFLAQKSLTKFNQKISQRCVLLCWYLFYLDIFKWQPRVHITTLTSERCGFSSLETLKVEYTPASNTSISDDYNQMPAIPQYSSIPMYTC